LSALALPLSSSAEEYLSAEQIGAISAASVGIHLLGTGIRNSAQNGKSLINGPILFDAKLQKILGGDCRPGKTNFLDNPTGSAVTPIATGLMLFASDMSWPETNKKGNFVAQDVFLFSSGLLATKGITGLAKGLVKRERPLPCLEPDIAGLRNNVDSAYDQSSFFSGHTSGAFFSAVYVNKRLRSIMRHQLSPDEYGSWRWAPPTILFSWASFVGWSRIHAYKHYFTDVAAGALAGFLVAQLFYSFNDYQEDGGVTPLSSASNQIFSIRFTF